MFQLNTKNSLNSIGHFTIGNKKKTNISFEIIPGKKQKEPSKLLLLNATDFMYSYIVNGKIVLIYFVNIFKSLKS